MLIFVLSYLLWQPDYSPRVEVGLPQMNLDAPRLLAHCFLYEVDKYLSSSNDREFVRYMDDIDIGVDSVVSARRVLQSVDLVLQARQVRLNSGKTLILTREQAAKHFRIFENYQLDRFSEIVDRRLKANGNLARHKKIVTQQINRGLARNAFDGGNGDKILKRWLGLAGKTKASITDRNVCRIILSRPSVRENAMTYVAATGLTPKRISSIADCIESGHLVDDAAVVDICNSLVETSVSSRTGRHEHLMRIIAACDPGTYFGLYATMWMQSKYCTPQELLETIMRARRLWSPHEQLGRIVGAFSPLFSGANLKNFTKEIIRSRNAGSRSVVIFHKMLSEDSFYFNSMYPVLKSPNTSKSTGISHAKFLCLLSALKNTQASPRQLEILRSANQRPLADVYYKPLLRPKQV